MRIPRMFVVVGAMVASSPAYATCSRATSRADLALAGLEAGTAFTEMDPERFERARVAVIAAVDCTQDVLPGADVATFHGVMAMAAFIRHDDVGAVNAFRGARAADTAWTLDPVVVPEGHPMRTQYTLASTLADGARRSIQSTAGRELLVDGAPGDTFPSDRPAVLQVLSEDGRVVKTYYILSIDGLPTWIEVGGLAGAGADPGVASSPTVVSTPATPEAPPEPSVASSSAVAPESPSTVATPKRKRKPVALTVLTGLAGVGTGVMLLEARQFHDIAFDSETPHKQIDAYANGANGLTIGAGVLGVVTVALGIGVGISW